MISISPVYEQMRIKDRDPEYYSHIRPGTAAQSPEGGPDTYTRFTFEFGFRPLILTTPPWNFIGIEDEQTCVVLSQT